MATITAVAILVGCAGNGDDATSDPSETGSTSTVPTGPTTSTSDGSGSTSTIDEPTGCDADVEEMLAVVDDSIGQARLEPGGPWVSETTASQFAERTQHADEFGYRTGLDCAVRLAQTTNDGSDRLLLAAWTGARRAWVVQASDAPAEAYRPDQRVQLFIGQPEGEWLVDQALWAGSLDTGETIVVGTVDMPFGVVAKAWWAEVPRFDDLPVSNDAERHGIDTLVAAGARNVSVGDPADVGSEMATIQFVTPLGLHLVATVAPPDWFDPAARIVEGDMTLRSVGDVEVFVTTAVPTSYAVGSVGWACGDHVWFIDSSYGTVDELLDWAAQVIDADEC